MPRDRERAQVVDAGRLGAAELGVLRLIAPRDERGEAAGLVLQLAEPEQVLEPLLHGLDRAVHHRRRRAQAGAVRVAHHVEPLVGRRLAVAVQDLADAIDEDLGAAAGMLSSPAAISRSITCRHRQLRQPRDVNDFRRRQRVQPERRDSALFTARNRSSYHANGRSGLWPALQQQLHAAERDRLVDLPEDLVEAEHVALGAIRQGGRTRRSCSSRRRRSCS